MSRVHVAVAVVCDEAGRILISRRHPDSHQGGLWEFPGGKLETGETVVQALRRELLEEVGIVVHEAEPLLEVRHDYSDKEVLLDVWRVCDFSGTARSLEGQALCWALPAELVGYAFPAANLPILEALVDSGACRQL